MTYDEIVALADRTEAKRQRGEEWEFQFSIEWWALTGAEREAFMALMNERIAHDKERLEAIEENVRILQLLFALEQGALTAMEFVERVRGVVPDPLAE